MPSNYLYNYSLMIADVPILLLHVNSPELQQAEITSIRKLFINNVSVLQNRMPNQFFIRYAMNCSIRR